MFRTVLAVCAAAAITFGAAAAAAAPISINASASYSRASAANATNPPLVLDQSELIFGDGPITLDLTFDADFTGLIPSISNVSGSLSWAGGVGGNVSITGGSIFTTLAVGNGFGGQLFLAQETDFGGAVLDDVFDLAIFTPLNPFFAGTADERRENFLNGSLPFLQPRLRVQSSPTGFLTTNVTFDVSPTSAIASVNAIPLPASATLLLSGLAGLGFAMRRRRDTAKI